MELDDDELYGDLDITFDRVVPAYSESGKKRTLSEYNATERERRNVLPNSGDHCEGLTGVKLKKEKESIRERIRILEEENSRLRRNIGTLFRTAKNEIQRKDDQIERLQQQVQQQEENLNQE